MSTNVEFQYCDYEGLLTALGTAGCTNRRLLERILGKFGNVLGDHYVILNNEHINPNPLYEIGNVLEAAFDPAGDGRFFDIILNQTTTGVSYADASEIAEELGIALPDPDDWK